MSVRGSGSGAEEQSRMVSASWGWSAVKDGEVVAEASLLNHR
jgi:hypothetical protein